MPNQFNSASDGDLEQYFATDYWLIEQYIGNELWVWGRTNTGCLGNAVTTLNLTISTPITTFAGGTNWKQIAMADFNGGGIKSDGTLWIWGSSSSGKLGNNSGTSVSTPVTTFAGGTDWKQLSMSTSNSAAIKTDGTLWLWGGGANGTLGNASQTDSSTPVTTFTGGNDWNQVHIGGAGCVAVKTDGTLWLWGILSNGAGGNNNPYDSNYSTPITTFTGGTNWKKAAIGSSAVIALKTDGTLWTWGNGNVGELGRRSGFTSNVNTPVTTFAGGTNWADTAGGLPEELYTIGGGGSPGAIKTDGTLWTWGNGANGRLGNALTTTRSTPSTTFAGGTDWKQFSSGTEIQAAIKTDRTLWVWGNGGSGQLGNAATTGTISTPVTTFAGGTNWKQVSCSFRFAVATKTDGTLWTWGEPSNGQLGNATITGNVSTPITTFAGGTNWESVNTTASSVVAIKTDGTLWTWGWGQSGRLGNADTTDRSTPVTTFAGGTNWEQAASSSSAAVGAIKTDGTLWVWGTGANGRLGNAATTGTISTPVTTFAGGTDWKQVSTSNQHMAAIKTDGTLWTWGNAGNGRLGNAVITGSISTPVTTFVGGTGWKQVATGSDYTIALSSTNELYVFGNNGGFSIGSYAADGNLVPNTTFAGGTNWKEICPGQNTCGGIKKDGTLWVWGNRFSNSVNLLGTGGTSGASVDTPITTFAGGNNWKSAYFSRLNAGALKTDGTLWVWGAADYGRLGNGSTSVNVSTPITTFAGGNDWKQIMASTSGDSHFGAVKFGTQADLPLS